MSGNNTGKSNKSLVLPISTTGMVSGFGEVELTWITNGDERDANAFVASLPSGQQPHAYANFIIARIIKQPGLTVEQAEQLEDGQVREILALMSEFEFIGSADPDPRLNLYEAIRERQRDMLNRMAEMTRPMVSPVAQAVAEYGFNLNSVLADITKPTIDMTSRMQDFYPSLVSQWATEEMDLQKAFAKPLLRIASAQLSLKSELLNSINAFEKITIVNLILADNQPLRFPLMIEKWDKIGSSFSELQDLGKPLNYLTISESFSELSRLSPDPITELYSSLQISDRMEWRDRTSDIVTVSTSADYIEIQSQGDTSVLVIRVDDLEEERALMFSLGKRRVEIALRELVHDKLIGYGAGWIGCIPSGTVTAIAARRGVQPSPSTLETYLSETTLGELFGIIEQKKLWSNHFENVFGDKQRFIVYRDDLIMARNANDHSNPLLSMAFNQAVVAIMWFSAKMGLPEAYTIEVNLRS